MPQTKINDLFWADSADAPHYLDRTYDLDKFDISPATVQKLISTLTIEHLSYSEDGADLYKAFSVLYDYLSADMLDDVYNADDPDTAPYIRATLDDLTTELHTHLATLHHFNLLAPLLKD